MTFAKWIIGLTLVGLVACGTGEEVADGLDGGGPVTISPVAEPANEPAAGTCIDLEELNRSIDLTAEFISLMEQGASAAEAGDVAEAVRVLEDASQLMSSISLLWADNDTEVSLIAMDVSNEMSDAADALAIFDVQSSVNSIERATIGLEDLTARLTEIEQSGPVSC